MKLQPYLLKFYFKQKQYNFITHCSGIHKTNIYLMNCLNKKKVYSRQKKIEIKLNNDEKNLIKIKSFIYIYTY